MYLCGKVCIGELYSSIGEYLPLWVLSILTHLLKSSSEFVTNQNLPAINSLQLSEAATSRALIRPIPTTPRSAAIFSPPESEEEQPKVFFDVGMKETVLRDGKMVNVSGFADYSLGHGKNKTSGNLIIVEAKKPSKLAEAPSQCLAYMGLFLRLYAVPIMLMNNGSDVPSRPS